VTLGRTATIAALLLTTAGSLAACSTVNDASPDNPVYGAPVYQVQLSTGPYLDCMESLTRGPSYVYDCDWDHPHANHDPSKELKGPVFRVFQKYTNDSRVMNCIAMQTSGPNSVDNCDWNHAKQVSVS
jgi:hypothetical protein